MSSTYVKPTIARRVVRPPRRRSGLLGLGAVLAGVTAVGAAVAIFLLPTAAPTSAPAIPLPAMDASMGYSDHVDTRPAISRSDTSMGFWDQVDARPAVSRSNTSMGFWDFVTVPTRPEPAALRPMPRSMGHWDFTLPKPEPTGLGFWDHIQ